jgi:predicted Rossmann fold nucleotide-binding protein DprA/Smf involved in DNA uptake
MAGPGLRAETEVTLLLCGNFGNTRRDEAVEPLTPREFNALLKSLERHSLALSDMAQPGTVDELREDPVEDQAFIERVSQLLRCGAALAMAVERWVSQGFWVIDRTDPVYPERFHQHLGTSSPPLLYGAGDVSLLNRDAVRVAVVGSRDIDDSGEQFARQTGGVSAQIDAITVSGGARGADRMAIDGALSNGGTGVAILPGSLEQVATSRMYRQAITDGQFTVISPYHPRAKFTAGNAMGRNRLIYCLADISVVVESAKGSGGTWSGAIETLKRRWVPVAARATEAPSAGNQALIEQGAVPLPPATLESPSDFTAWLETVIGEHERARWAPDRGQLELFD